MLNRRSNPFRKNPKIKPERIWKPRRLVWLMNRGNIESKYVIKDRDNFVMLYRDEYQGEIKSYRGTV